VTLHRFGLVTYGSFLRSGYGCTFTVVTHTLVYGCHTHTVLHGPRCGWTLPRLRVYVRYTHTHVHRFGSHFTLVWLRLPPRRLVHFLFTHGWFGSLTHFGWFAVCLLLVGSPHAHLVVTHCGWSTFTHCTFTHRTLVGSRVYVTVTPHTVYVVTRLHTLRLVGWFPHTFGYHVWVTCVYGSVGCTLVVTVGYGCILYSRLLDVFTVTHGYIYLLRFPPHVTFTLPRLRLRWLFTLRSFVARWLVVGLRSGGWLHTHVLRCPFVPHVVGCWLHTYIGSHRSTLRYVVTHVYVAFGWLPFTLRLYTVAVVVTFARTGLRLVSRFGYCGCFVWLGYVCFWLHVGCYGWLLVLRTLRCYGSRFVGLRRYGSRCTLVTFRFPVGYLGCYVYVGCYTVGCLRTLFGRLPVGFTFSRHVGCFALVGFTFLRYVLVATGYAHGWFVGVTLFTFHFTTLRYTLVVYGWFGYWFGLRWLHHTVCLVVRLVYYVRGLRLRSLLVPVPYVGWFAFVAFGYGCWLHVGLRYGWLLVDAVTDGTARLVHLVAHVRTLRYTFTGLRYGFVFGTVVATFGSTLFCCGLVVTVGLRYLHGCWLRLLPFIFVGYLHTFTFTVVTLPVYTFGWLGWIYGCWLFHTRFWFVVGCCWFVDVHITRCLHTPHLLTLPRSVVRYGLRLLVHTVWLLVGWLRLRFGWLCHTLRLDTVVRLRLVHVWLRLRSVWLLLAVLVGCYLLRLVYLRLVPRYLFILVGCYTRGWVGYWLVGLVVYQLVYVFVGHLVVWLVTVYTHVVRRFGCWFGWVTHFILVRSRLRFVGLLVGYGCWLHTVCTLVGLVVWLFFTHTHTPHHGLVLWLDHALRCGLPVTVGGSGCSYLPVLLVVTLFGCGLRFPRFTVVGYHVVTVTFRLFYTGWVYTTTTFYVTFGLRLHVCFRLVGWLVTIHGWVGLHTYTRTFTVLFCVHTCHCTFHVTGHTVTVGVTVYATLVGCRFVHGLFGSIGLVTFTVGTCSVYTHVPRVFTHRLVGAGTYRLRYVVLVLHTVYVHVPG